MAKTKWIWVAVPIILGLLVLMLVVRAPGVNLSDTEADIFPDPVARTALTIRSLQRVVGEFEARNGALPRDLDELMTFARDLHGEGEAGLRFDAWGRSVLYSVSGNSFELRSSGADGVVQTQDDVVSGNMTQ